MSDLPRGAFNLPPGCSIRDIEGTNSRPCERCGEDIDPESESDLCGECQRDKSCEEED